MQTARRFFVLAQFLRSDDPATYERTRMSCVIERGTTIAA
jgi:hypothetical protein